MSRETVQVRLLGPVDVTVDGVARPIPGLRRKSVLAVLALHAGEMVSARRLIDAVWSGDPPATVTNSLQGHIAYLRRVLGAPDAIAARSAGYRLNLPVGAVDVGQATHLIASTARGGDHADTAAQLTAALQLWRGASLADVADVTWLRDQGRRLDETRLETIERLVEARLALGEHLLLVAELEDLAGRYPLRESLHRLLVLALYRCGRQADALNAYHRLRRMLGGELGIEPGPALRDLETAILRQDPRLDPPAAAPPAATAQRTPITPAQLPATLAAFAGRHHETAHLQALLPNPEPDTPQPHGRLVVISGTAGVGKTTLAIHFAHQIRHRYPDGQLYINLRGYDPSNTTVAPAEAIHTLLHALGAPPDQIPTTPHAQTNLYRSMLAGKRILIVADNAYNEQQIRPLLPGTPGCLVLVTSRNQLPGLVATDGAHALTLDRPSHTEARQILTQRLGATRVDAEPQAVDDIITGCARLPLALAIAAARAALVPTVPLASLAAQLRDTAALDSFDSADPATSIRAVLSWSYQTLSQPAAQLFRLLGPCPGPDIALPAVASVVGMPIGEVRPLLAELTRAHLLTETSPGRYGFHELLRAYAIEQAQRHDTAQEQTLARHRFLDHHLRTAHAASLLLKPGRSRIEPAPPVTGVTPQQLPDCDAALAWFAAERGVLLATVTRPADGHDRHTWQLAWALMAMLTRRGDMPDNETVQRAGLRAAQRLGDPIGKAHAHRSLGKVYSEMGRLANARHHSQLALHLFEQLDNAIATTDIHLNLGKVAEGQGDLQRALVLFMHAHRSYRSLGHVVGQAYAAHNIAWCHHRLGNHDEGLAYCHEALDILIEVDDLEATANTWSCLGDLNFDAGELRQGEHCYQQAITLYRRLGDRSGEADVHTNRGDQHHRAGNPRAAHQAWRQALSILDDFEPDMAAELRTRISTS